MPRRRNKTAREAPPDGTPAPEAAPEFRPFADALKGLVATAAVPARPLVPEKPPPARAPERPPAVEGDEGRALLEAMAGVKPLSARERERVAPAKTAPSTAPLYDEDAEALARLAAMVDGQEPMDWEHSDEHSEWIADDVDPGILPRLVAGEFAWQGHLDLHGMTRDPARDALVRFLAGARVQGFRCVLVVHGRGKHSEDASPVLKPLVQRWLRRAPLKSWIFAYATARQVDGGAGAMYVLLRR